MNRGELFYMAALDRYDVQTCSPRSGNADSPREYSGLRRPSAKGSFQVSAQRRCWKWGDMPLSPIWNQGYMHQELPSMPSYQFLDPAF